MTVDFIFKLVKYICNQNQRGDISSSRFNIIIPQAQASFTSYLIGEYSKYQPGRAVPPVALGVTKRIRQTLAPLIEKPLQLIVNGVTGIAPYPADFVYVDAMYTSDKKRIRYVEQNELVSYLEDEIDPVESNPIYLIQKEGFQFYPITIINPLISFIKNPPNIVWAFSLDSNQREVYDPSNSVDPIWEDVDCLEIITRALRMIGVNMQANEVSQYANEIKTIGQ